MMLFVVLQEDEPSQEMESSQGESETEAGESEMICILPFILQRNTVAYLPILTMTFFPFFK